MRPASLPSARCACLTNTTRQALGPERVDQPVHVADDVARVLHVGRAVLVEVLALHVDDEERHLPVCQVVDHLSRLRSPPPLWHLMQSVSWESDLPSCWPTTLLVVCAWQPKQV